MLFRSSEKVSAAALVVVFSVLVDLLMAADGLLRCAEVVDNGVQAHVRLHVHAAPEVGHDLVHARLEIGPSADTVSSGSGERAGTLALPWDRLLEAAEAQ